MANKINNPQIPLIYAYLYMKIKKQMKGDRIAGSALRKVIQRTILCDKGRSNEGISRSKKGLPRRYCYDIIKDLINLNLIEKIGNVRNDQIYKENNEKTLEVVERLKDWNISERLRKDKVVKEKLGEALSLLDKDPLYRVVKSQCNKKLKQSFW